MYTAIVDLQQHAKQTISDILSHKIILDCDDCWVFAWWQPGLAVALTEALAPVVFDGTSVFLIYNHSISNGDRSCCTALVDVRMHRWHCLGLCSSGGAAEV